MISEQQEEQASLYALGALGEAESRTFEAELRGNLELCELVRGLQRTTDLLARSILATPLPPSLRDKVLQWIEVEATSRKSATPPPPAMLAGLHFVDAADSQGWKPLPVPGAFIKLLSLEKERGYAVLLGKLEPGVRYPAHTNPGPEDFYILTGDLHIGERRIGPGDFHHA